MKVITAQEALRDYANYAVMNVVKNRAYGLYADVDTANRIASDLCKRYGEGTYETAVIV